MATNTTGNNFAIGSIETPFENISTKVLARYRDANNDPTHVFLAFVEFVNELCDPGVQRRLRAAHIKVDNTLEMFQSDSKRGYVLPMLTLSMGSFPLQSILMGTVARDAFRGSNSYWPDKDGPGIYAVGVSVNCRNGAFLTSAELENLASEVTKYVDAYTASNVPSGLRTTQNKDSVAFAKAVDSAVNLFKGSGCRFITCDEDADRATLFAARLRHRASCARLVDPSGSSVHMQSPLYIGCSDMMSTRIASYDPPIFGSINKLLGLTLCLLFHMDLPAKAVARPVMLVWTDDLDKAERLVTTLASSLVAQDGFNATEAGGNKGNARGGIHRHNRRQVFLERPDLRINLRKAVQTLQSITEFQENVQGLTNDFGDLELDVSDTISRAESQVMLQGRPWSELYSELLEGHESTRDVLKVKRNDKLLQSMKEVLLAMHQESRARQGTGAVTIPSSDMDVD